MSTYFQPGRYWVKVTKQAMGETSNGNAQFVVSFQVLGKIRDDDPDGQLEPVQGYERSIFGVFTDKTIKRRLKDIAYLCECGGITTPLKGFELLDPETPGCINFFGVEFEATCQHGINNRNEPKEEWNIASGPGGGLEVKPLDNKGLRNLNQLFGKELKSLSASAPPQRGRTVAQPASEPAPVPAYLNEKEAIPPDDIPF